MTLGVEALLDPKYSGRKDSAFVEDSVTRLLQIDRAQFQRLKFVLYQMGLKTDYLVLESAMRKCWLQQRR